MKVAVVVKVKEELRVGESVRVEVSRRGGWVRVVCCWATAAASITLRMISITYKTYKG